MRVGIPKAGFGVQRANAQADGTSWQLRRATLAESYLEMCHANFDKNACSLGGGPESYLVDHTVEKVFYDDADIRHLKNLYDAGVRQLDTELSRLFGFLYEKELLDKTLLIILSDHGEGFSEHGEVDHFLSTYQELLHVPLLIRGPGVPRGKRIAAPVSLIDIVPTILRQVDAPLPEPLDGFDLAPLWREGAKEETRRTFDVRFLYGEASGKQPQILADLKEEMTERYSEFSATPSDEHKVEIDEEDAKALRALGYIQ